MEYYEGLFVEKFHFEYSMCILFAWMWIIVWYREFVDNTSNEFIMQMWKLWKISVYIYQELTPLYLRFEQVETVYS